MGTQTLRIIHTVSSLKGGGMEHFVLRLAEAQRRRGHDARVLSILGGPLAEHAERMGVPTKTLEGGGAALRVLRGAFELGRFRPQVIHAHNPTSLHYAVIGKMVSGARLVVTDHAQTRGIVRVPRAAEWLLTDAVVAVSGDTAKKSLAAPYVGNILVFHNGIEIASPKRTRAELRRELGIAEDTVVGLNVAGFVPVKAHDVLVRAMGHVRDGGGKAMMLLAGDGPEREAVTKLADELSLGPDHLRFLGFRKDVTDLLGAVDFFVLASRDEGLPLSVLEAMSQRLPVIATPVGGNPELVTEGEHGLFVPVDDDRALGRAIEQVAGDAELRARLGEAGRKRVEEEFSFEGMTQKYEDLYQRLVRGSGEA